MYLNFFIILGTNLGRWGTSLGPNMGTSVGWGRLTTFLPEEGPPQSPQEKTLGAYPCREHAQLADWLLKSCGNVKEFIDLFNSLQNPAPWGFSWWFPSYVSNVISVQWRALWAEDHAPMTYWRELEGHILNREILTLKWPRGGFLHVGTQDLFFPHFTTFASAFFTVIFSNCLTIGYASFDAKKIEINPVVFLLISIN